MSVIAAGDEGSIRIGSNSNVQDNSTIQSNKSFLGEHHGPTSIGDSVTVGHGVYMDSVTIEDEALIGMGATLLQGVKVLLKAADTYCKPPQARLLFDLGLRFFLPLTLSQVLSMCACVLVMLGMEPKKRADALDPP